MVQNRPSEQNSDGILKSRIWLHNQYKKAPKPVDAMLARAAFRRVHKKKDYGYPVLILG